MTDSVLRHSLLRGYLMLDYNTTEELGTVDGLLVDISRSRVVELVCQGPVWQRQRITYSWQQVTNIGADSIVLHVEGAANANAAAQIMVGLEVWTDTGNCVGQILDYQFEPQGDIVQYLFGEPSQPGLYGLPPDTIISAGRKRIMVSAQAADQAAYLPNEAVPVLRQGTAQSLADQMQQQAESWSNYAQERWLSEDFNEQVQAKARQLQTRTEGLRSQLNQQVSNAKKRLRPLNRAVENTLDNTLEKLTDSQDTSTLDLESFEVWEDD